MSDKTIITQVQQANDIVDIISEHVGLVRRGKEMVGLCPFHEDHRPSLYVNPAKQIFKCFACGAGGDVLKFVQMRENLSFPQAIERLAERAGIKLKQFSPARAKDHTSGADLNSLARVNEWAAKYFQANLTDPQRGNQACKYLAERQISPESVKKWRIGLAVTGDDLVRAAKARDIPTKLLTDAGLVLNQGNALADKFVNRLMFPISDVTDRVIGFGGRTLDGTGAKYMNSPTTALFDKSNCIYGLNLARRQIASATAVIVEGYTDCIMAHQFGCTNVVATLGTSFTTGHARILRRYAKRIVLVFDSDIAGLEAANRALEVCLSQKMDIKMASVPQGKDPCDFILTAGSAPFEELIDNAVDVFQFKWNRLIENLGRTDTIVDHKAALEEYLRTIAAAIRSGNLSVIDRGLIVNRIANILVLDSKLINAELDKRITTLRKAAGYPERTAAPQKTDNADFSTGSFAVAKREVLEVLLNEPKLFEIVKQKITTDVFDTPILGQIAAIVFETLTAEPDASLTSILARVESVELGGAIVELAQTGEKKGNYHARLTGALATVERHLTKRQENDIKGIADPAELLRRLPEKSEKQNPHSVGLV